MTEFLNLIGGWFAATRVPEQISQVDASGLFSNWYFLAPFICLVIYLLYKQSFTNLLLIGIGIGVWFFSGTQYMQELIVNGEVQLNKVLPLALGAVVVLAVVIYLLFGRSD